MTVRVNKQPFNIREKLSELERPIGIKGNELMGAETAQDARDLVSAGRKNLVINGDFKIAQRGTTTVSVGAGAADGYQLHDRWRVNKPGLDSLTADYSHQGGDSSLGFRNSARFTCTAAESLGSGERFSFETRIEAQDAVFLGWGSSKTKPITISFWVKSNLPGKYGVHVRHHDPGNGYVFPYTINQSDVWEYKTYTVPGDPYGTTNDDNGLGFWIRFMLVSGDVASSADENWSTTDSGPNTTPGAVAWGSATGHTWEIMGVQVEAGSNATDFEHRSYGEEIALCQRYYERHTYTASQYIGVAVHYQTGTNLRMPIQFLTRKRTTNPTVSYSGTYNSYPPNEAATLTGSEDNDTSARINITVATSYDGGTARLILATAGTYLEIEDEL